MPKQYDNEARGVMFRNNDKERQEQPDYRGSLTLQHIDYWLSGWIKDHDELGRYVQIRVTPKVTLKSKASGKGKQLDLEG